MGAFLSGGLDSSLVVALAAGHTRGRLQTFSMGFQEESFSELPYARQVARQFGTSHVEAIVTADAVELLDELTKFYDEPFADPSAVPTYLVSRLAAKHVKVVLSGDGGDEAFGGYARSQVEEDALAVGTKVYERLKSGQVPMVTAKEVQEMGITPQP